MYPVPIVNNGIGSLKPIRSKGQIGLDTLAKSADCIQFFYYSLAEKSAVLSDVSDPDCKKWNRYREPIRSKGQIGSDTSAKLADYI